MAINLYSKDSVDTLLAAKLSDAPSDGSTYGRKDGAWEVVGGGGSFNGGTITAPIVVDESATSGFTTTFNGNGLQMGGGQYISQEESVVSGFNISLQVSGTVDNIGALSFADSTTQTTAASPFNGGTVNTAISVTGSGGTVSIGDSIGINLSGSTAGAGITFADSTVQTTAAVAPPSADVMTANAIAANVNFLTGSTGTWVGNGLPSIAGLVSWGIYNVTDGLIAYSYSSGSSFYLASAISTSNNTVQISGSNSSFYVA
jgi:hypothetical protein